MNKTSLFFSIASDIYSPYAQRGHFNHQRQKESQRLNFSYCMHQCIGMHKIPCALVGKLKEPACIKDR
jgi:hypothetical protein